MYLLKKMLAKKVMPILPSLTAIKEVISMVKLKIGTYKNLHVEGSYVEVMIPYQLIIY